MNDSDNHGLQIAVGDAIPLHLVTRIQFPQPCNYHLHPPSLTFLFNQMKQQLSFGLLL